MLSSVASYRSRIGYRPVVSIINNYPSILDVRWYVSRAHPPKSIPTYFIEDALKSVLEGVEERKIHREKRWEKYKFQRERKGMKIEGPYRNQDETIELSLNLNLDPRKPGQSLRGSVSLPNGTGKKMSIIVFTEDGETATAAMAAGATVAGGSDLIQQIQDGTQAVTFNRVIATPDVMPSLSKVARILGPRGLMPNAKLNTIQPSDKIIDAVKETAGVVQYRTENNGIIQAGIGKGSFDSDALLENIRAFMNEIQSVKPESFGKGKKKANMKNAKFYLKAHLTAAQGKGSTNINLATIDPTSPFFMDKPTA